MSDLISINRLDAGARNTRLLTLIVSVLVLLGLSVKFCLWFHVPIDQDEFYCLSLVHAFQHGQLLQTFQSFHVHLFSWLAHISVNELTQAMAARSVMLLLFLGTCCCIYLLGRRLLGAAGGIFSVLCYISLIHTVRNGASFRTDTPATFLFMAALCWFVRKDQSVAGNVVAGLAMAVSCLLTIKAGFYLGAFAALFCVYLLGSRDPRQTVRHLLHFIVPLLAVYLILYKLHASTFPSSAAGSGGQFLQRATATFMSLQLATKLPSLLYTLRWDTVIWLLFIVGLGASTYRLATKRVMWASGEAQLIALSVPLLSIAFYRNAYPYFYPFIMPSAVLLCGYGFGVVRTTLEKISPRLTPVCCAAIAIIISQILLACGSCQAE